MTAPTEAEIREIIEARARKNDNALEHLELAIDEAGDALLTPMHEDGRYDFDEAYMSDLWTDLRPSEADRLAELVEAAKAELRTTIWPQILNVIVEAGVRFAKEHPDAPRAGAPVSAATSAARERAAEATEREAMRMMAEIHAA